MILSLLISNPFSACNSVVDGRNAFNYFFNTETVI